MKLSLLSIFAMAMLMLVSCTQKIEENMQISQEWDKVFPLSETVNHRKVEFKNQYGITLVGDLYTPKSGATGWLLRCVGLLARQRNSRADSMP